MKKLVLLVLVLLANPFLWAHPIYIGTRLKEEFPFAADPKSRITGDPYINSNSFRCIANWRLDFTDEPIDPEKVQKGDIIYVNGSILGNFMADVNPYITVPYILLVHDSDNTTVYSMRSSLNIVAIGSSNCSESIHPKVIPIPLGIPNGVAKGYAKKENYTSIAALNVQKSIFCSSNFRDFCHDRRKYATEVLKSKSFVTKLSESSVETYVYNLASSKFCISPRGAGVDCYRTWEALIFNCIPIVETSFLDPLFYKLPVLIVDDFDQLTETRLVDFYNFFCDHKDEFMLEKIYMKYWSDFFLQLQNLVRQDLDYDNFIKEFKKKSFGI